MFARSSFFLFVAFAATTAPKVMAQAATLTMSCPERLVPNTTATVTCVVNTTQIAAAGCLATPTTVTFTQHLVGQPAGTACATRYSDACGSESVSSEGCGCTGQVEDVKTFEYKFVADPSKHEGAEFECSVCVASQSIELVQNGCESLTFKEQSEVTTPPLSDTESSEDGLSGGAIAGIVVACVGGVLIIVGIILFVRSKKGREYARANT